MKVKIVNCEDGKESTCFLTEKKFKTDKGVAFMLNGRVISPVEALKYSELEFDENFVVPGNFNTRQGVAQYIQALGISRQHDSYIKSLAKLSDGLPLGEIFHRKGE
jgi:hypothetical protein